LITPIFIAERRLTEVVHQGFDFRDIPFRRV
jgi:hypothetical protein